MGEIISIIRLRLNRLWYFFNLYTSIVTDTGSMKYSNILPTIEDFAELVDKSKPDYVSRQVFEKEALALSVY